MKPFERQYTNAVRNLLEDSGIHPINRGLFQQFFKYESYKLKRFNRLQQLDEASYKTLYYYIVRFRNVNRWFNNKPLTDLTREDVKRVYDDLEDGKILNKYGQPYASRSDYYRKVLKSKLFEMAGVDKLAKEVITFAKPNRKPVRFIREQAFRKLIRRVRQPRSLLLLWLAWDYGENIGALIQLVPEDFYRQIDDETGEPEYRVHFRPEILKRSRSSRSELSNHPETVDLLDEVLPTIAPGQRIFTFSYAYAKKIMTRATKASKVVCEPNGDRVTWKDLRSGMACDLLSKGWTRDEVNARLGHKPSSGEIDRYLNFLALDRRRPKQKLAEYRDRQLGQHLDRARHTANQQSHQNELFSQELATQQAQMHEQLAAMKKALLAEVRAEIEATNVRQAA